MPKFHVQLRIRTATSGSDAAARAFGFGCHICGIRAGIGSLRILTVRIQHVSLTIGIRA